MAICPPKKIKEQNFPFLQFEKLSLHSNADSHSTKTLKRFIIEHVLYTGGTTKIVVEFME